MGFVLFVFLFFCLFVWGFCFVLGGFFWGVVVFCCCFLLLFAHSIFSCLYLFKAQARCPGHTPVCLYVCLSRTVSRFC